MKKNESLHIRVSPDDVKTLKKAAKKASLTVSELVRQFILSLK